MAIPDHYMQPGTTQSVNPNNSSAAFASAFNSRFVRIYSPFADVFVKFGPSAPTATAADYPIMAGLPEIIDVGEGNIYGAVFCSSDVVVYATPMK